MYPSVFQCFLNIRKDGKSKEKILPSFDFPSLIYGCRWDPSHLILKIFFNISSTELFYMIAFYKECFWPFDLYYPEIQKGRNNCLFKLNLECTNTLLIVHEIMYLYSSESDSVVGYNKCNLWYQCASWCQFCCYFHESNKQHSQKTSKFFIKCC